MSTLLRRRRTRAVLAVAATAALTLSATSLAFADSVAVDGDVVKAPVNILYATTADTAHNACSTRGTAVTGSLVIEYNNSGGGSDKHFNAGETLDIDLVADDPGITATATPAAPVVPGNWGAGTTVLNVALSTTVSNSVADGSHTVDVTVTGADVVRTDKFNVIVDCAVAPPSNTAPSVAFTTVATTSDEGSAVGYAFTITDPDAGQTWTYANGYPDCDGGTASSATIDNATKTGSFTCLFPDGPATHTVAVKVTDSAAADSNEATVGATVNNVNPDVLAPSFSLTSVDCRTEVTLGAISFSDPGLVDDDWTVDIDWGDGTAHTSYTTATQGLQADRTHTYNVPGTYSATVTVTDKDAGSDSATSSNSITVKQVYNTDFLPPFDDSTPSGLIVNQMKNGRTVPVKATIFDVCTNAYVTAPSVVTLGVKKTTVNGTPTQDAVETYSDAGASSANTNLARWNADATSPTGGFWIYNLDSKGLALITNQHYRVDLYVGGVQATVKNWGVLLPVK